MGQLGNEPQARGTLADHMDPQDFCERLGFDNDVVPDTKFDGNGFNDLVDGRIVFGLKKGD